MSALHERPAQLPPPTPINRGQAGTSSPLEVERRVATRTGQRPVGFLGQFAKHVLKFPVTATDWARRPTRERRLGSYLDRSIGDFTIVLHHRRMPDNSIADHIIVAATGVWVVAAQHDAGRIERRQSTPGGVALIGEDRNVSHVDVDAARHVAAVSTCVDRIGFDWVDIHAAACFTNGQWGRFAKAFVVDDVWVTWPKAMSNRIGGPGPLDPGDARTVAAELSSAFPATK